jgi:hypothetical protein
MLIGIMSITETTGYMTAAAARPASLEQRLEAQVERDDVDQVNEKTDAEGLTHEAWPTGIESSGRDHAFDRASCPRCRLRGRLAIDANGKAKRHAGREDTRKESTSAVLVRTAVAGTRCRN